MNRIKVSLVAASLLVAGTLGAQQPKPAAKKAEPAHAAAPATAHADSAHKKPAKGAKHDSAAKHDTTHAAAPKKPAKPGK